MKKNRIASFALIVLTAVAGLTCRPNIGLGGQIDIVPPEGEITYPDAGETPIRGSFMLKGTASDDDGIESITVVFENIETKARSSVYTAEGFTVGSTPASWTVNVANEATGAEEAPHELVKIYPIPDGEYTAILTVTDKGGKSTTVTKNYKIDNTPPVFIVSRPSTVVNISGDSDPQADGYGATFSVIGQAGERNTVEKLNVLIPDTTPLINLSNMFVGNNINAQVAVYGTEPNALYDLQAKDRSKPIKGQLYLYDNAREYKGDPPAGEGNKADWFYLWNEIYTDVIAKGYTPEVISDYFAGKKGSDKDDHDKKIAELRNDTVALNKLKSAMTRMSEKLSIFKLDPSKSPGFKVIGAKNLPKKTLNFVQASSMLFKAGSETSFSVELIRNKDNIPLVAGSDLEAYKKSNIEIVLLKWDGTGNELDCFKTGEHLTEKSLLKFSDLTDTGLITIENGNLRVKCTFNPAWDEGYYALQVKGTDSSTEESNRFAAYDDSNSVNDGIYIINFLAVGTGPRIRPIRPQTYQNANFEIFADITGIDSTGEVYYNIDAEVNAASPDTTKKLTKATLNPSDPKYKATIDISGLADGEHKIYFLVKAGSGATDADSTDFTVDKKAPVVEISFPLPTDPQAGKITISGTINDGTGSGVKEDGTKYILGKKPSTPSLTDSGWLNMTTSTKGSWNVDVDLDTMSAHPATYGTQVGTSSYYKVPLYIRTEDMLGNATVHTKEILFNSDGTKPVVRVLSPQAGAVVGGTIQLFGTASAVIGGPSAVGDVYIQFSHDGSFANASDGTFGTSTTTPVYNADWYNGGNGQLIPGTGSGSGEKGSEWQLEINGNGSFNGTSQRQDVYFRLRAKNKNNSRLGEWTTPVKIIVDKDAPLITDVKIENDSGTPSPQNYETNMWIGRGKKLTAKLTDPSGIKEVTITSDKMSGGISYTQANTPEGWLTPYNLGGVSGYTLSIPLDINGMSGNDFSIKVAIKENTTTGLSSDSTFTFRFDTTPPKGFFGSGLYINSGYFGTNSITNAALADKLGDLGANTSSGAGCKILAEDTELTVTGVSGSTVNFSPSLPAAKEYNYILYKPEVLIYNTDSSSPWIVNGVANDDSSGIAKVEAWVKVDTTETTPHTIITETDNTNKITRQLGGQVTWKGQINLSSLKDGKGKLHYKITDKSGNTYTAPAVDVRVKNKQLKVTTITLSTDIGGSAAEFANDNVNKALKNIAVDSNLDFTAKYTSSAFAFKNENNSKIKVNFDGGQGQVEYSLKYNNAVLAGHDMQNIPNNRIITLSAANLSTIGNTTGETTKELVLELWDSAHDCTPTGAAPLEKSSFAQIKINTLFDAIDNTSPTVVILPFHWNGESDNSLYQNSRQNGHVEIGAITALGNDYSSVSGKVTLHGFAYDNVKIDSIKATLPFNTPLTLTATRSGTVFSSSETMSANNAELKVTQLGADYLGYYVKWELSFDSSKIPMDAAKDIKVIANDGTRDSGESAGTDIPTTYPAVTRGGETEASGNDFAAAKAGQFVVFQTGEKQYFTRIIAKTGNTVTFANAIPTDMTQAAVYGYTANKTKVWVNSVPYISAVTTTITNSAGADFDRSALGFYPVYAGEKITLKGFNIASSPTVKLGTKDLTSKVSAYNQAAGTFAVEIEDTADVKTGELTITVGTTNAINNGNKNPVIGTDGTVTEAAYNSWQNKANKRFTDDLKLSVWKVDDFHTSIQQDITSPMLKIALDSRWYMSYGEGIPYLIVNKNGTKKKVDESYNKFHNTAVAYDGSGNIYALATNTDRVSDHSAKFSFYSRDIAEGRLQYNDGTYDSGFNARSYQFNWTGKARLEKVFNQSVYDINRVRRPKLVVSGTTSEAKIYMSYFDANHPNNPVKFRYGTVDGSNDFTHGIKDGGSGVSPYTSYAMDGRPEGSAPDFHTVADKNTEYKGGEYTAVGVTSGGVAVVAWYDASEKRLVYSYNDAPQTPVQGGAWQTNAKVIDSDFAGWYVDLAVDEKDGIHIAYYSSSKGDLKYAYLPAYNGTATVVTVDSYLSVGTQISISTRNEGTSAVPKIVPYISYFQSAFTQTPSSVRVAWLHKGVGTAGVEVKDGAKDDLFTTNWEVMTIPMKDIIPKDEIICNGVPISGGWADTVVLGFMSDSGYKKAVLRK
ncbi:hypothetical protein [Treponema vincentii]|uniref:hypothetical protein n=1 Tax=Treponema vincentii TaxID=69710 RepID=UPI0020A313DE|nr:hypothetical protein [Treponema vincentii]UTC49039.1 hypothetical protein E4N73_09400 [Treponema vincentii]